MTERTTVMVEYAIVNYRAIPSAKHEDKQVLVDVRHETTTSRKHMRTHKVKDERRKPGCLMRIERANDNIEQGTNKQTE